MKQVYFLIFLVLVVVAVGAYPANKKSGKPSKLHKAQLHRKPYQHNNAHHAKGRGPRALYEPFIFQDAPQLGGSRLGQDIDIYRSELEPYQLQATRKYGAVSRPELYGPERLGYSLRPNSDGSRLITMPWKTRSLEAFEHF